MQVNVVDSTSDDTGESSSAAAASHESPKNHSVDTQEDLFIGKHENKLHLEVSFVSENSFGKP